MVLERPTLDGGGRGAAPARESVAGLHPAAAGPHVAAGGRQASPAARSAGPAARRPRLCFPLLKEQMLPIVERGVGSRRCGLSPTDRVLSIKTARSCLGEGWRLG